MIEQLLLRTSRTFALSIPLLPPPVRQSITVGYLLFRIADTFEDEASWTVSERVSALASFQELLRREASGAAVAQPALNRVDVADGSYAELLRNADAVLDAFRQLAAEARTAIVEHLDRTIDGMQRWLLRDRAPTSVEEVQEYCYFVAGIVGELCTDLFVLHSPALRSLRQELRSLAPSFGEALQLVNILRDERDDADDGRFYLPANRSRHELLSVAREDLRKAADYVALLERAGADPGIVGFNALNLSLAIATLQRVSELGPGVKLSREEVTATFESIAAAARRGEPITPLLSPPVVVPTGASTRSA